MAFAFRKWGSRGTRAATATAVLREVADEFVHVLEVGAIDDEAAFLAASYQSGAREMGEVKRQGRRRQIELLADAPRGETVGTCLDEQTVDLQARLLRESGERVDDLCHFHSSRIVEMTRVCQAVGQARGGCRLDQRQTSA